MMSLAEKSAVRDKKVNHGEDKKREGSCFATNFAFSL